MVQDIINYVKANMLGRMADEQDNVLLMVQTALCDGNHLEIGTLHGGSALAVALAKKECGYKGKVFCIDPLDGYYTDKKFGKKVDQQTNIPISIDTLVENQKRFDIELVVIRAKSFPFPLYGFEFETAYIDGDHWDEMPMLDFINVSAITNQFITFDNCDKKHPDVVRACDYAEKKWKPYLRKGITCIVRNFLTEKQ